MLDLDEIREQGRRIEQFVKLVGAVLRNDSQRTSFALYALGLMSEGDRKSIEPIAARVCPDVTKVSAAYQRIHHFIADANWNDEEVRCVASKYALSAMHEREPVEVSIIDDTGLLKQGNHSVGVQRQYTGSAGKVTNCQLGVSLSVATRTEQLPLDFELYLPETWANDPALREKGQIPEHIKFQTKPELALNMISRALRANIQLGTILADSAYGNSRDFRAGVRSHGLDYAVGVCPTTVVRLLDNMGRPRGDAISVRDLAFQAQSRGGFRSCTWRKGTKKDLSARFVLRRVVIADDAKVDPNEREHLWLLIEWRDGETEPANYFLSSLKENMNKRKLIRIVMQRWRTERVYEDLKGELGFDHFEGRRFKGWHHHVTVVLCCYAFIVAERVRRFPPRPEGRHPVTRSPSRPERHFHDSFITARLFLARVIATWLPRCPVCHHCRPDAGASPEILPAWIHLTHPT